MSCLLRRFVPHMGCNPTQSCRGVLWRNSLFSGDRTPLRVLSYPCAWGEKAYSAYHTKKYGFRGGITNDVNYDNSLIRTTGKCAEERGGPFHLILRHQYNVNQGKGNLRSVACEGVGEGASPDYFVSREGEEHAKKIGKR